MYVFAKCPFSNVTLHHLVFSPSSFLQFCLPVSACLLVNLAAFLSVCLSVSLCLSVFLSVCRPLCLLGSTCLIVRLSVLYACMSLVPHVRPAGWLPDSLPSFNLSSLSCFSPSFFICSGLLVCSLIQYPGRKQS